jgi:hypothetical protein
MKFNIKAYSSIGTIKFGMRQSEVRNLLGTNYKSFKRTPASEYPCDYFKSLGVFVYYKKSGVVEAVEFATPAEPSFEGKDLLNLSYDDLRNFFQSKDANLEIEPDSLTSLLLGISAYTPDADENPQLPAESIIAFESGYY